MAQTYKEGTLIFSFPDDWKVNRPENSKYYVNEFQNFAGGCKEMDFLAFNPANCDLWLIEVKDYSANARMKIGTVWDEVALKVRDVLSLLNAGAVMDHSSDPRSQESLGSFARSARAAAVIKVALHYELPSRNSKLFVEKLDLRNIRDKLERAIKPIHKKPFVINLANPAATAWKVSKAVVDGHV